MEWVYGSTLAKRCWHTSLTMPAESLGNFLGVPMSHLQFPCPECQVNLRLPTSLAGKTIRCQRCKCVFKVVVPSDKPEAKKAEAPDRPKSASSPVQASRPERSGKPART